MLSSVSLLRNTHLTALGLVTVCCYWVSIGRLIDQLEMQKPRITKGLILWVLCGYGIWDHLRIQVGAMGLVFSNEVDKGLLRDGRLSVVLQVTR